MLLSNLTTEKTSKLFFRYLIPSISGTMVTSIYVLADTIIIGKGIGVEAMAALNIVLPLFALFFGLGLLFGIGGSVMMSVCRGQGDMEGGHRYFSLSLLSTFIASFILFLFCLRFLTDIALFLGGTEVTMPYITEYLFYIVWGLSGFMFSSFLQTFVRNDGAPKLSMIAVVTGGITNVILDIIFVYPLGMGMSGAAIASVIGSVLTSLILVSHFFTKANNLRFTFKGLSFFHWLSIFKTGFASFLLDVSSGFVMFIMNLQILRYIGDIGISVYGIITNTSIIIFCLSNGVSQAAQPILSTNYGAKLPVRILEVRKLAMKTVFLICSVFTILAWIAPNLFTYIFMHPNEAILSLAPSAIRIYFTAFSIIGLNMFMINYFQATVHPKNALLLCLLRGFVLSTLFVFILPSFFGIMGIWIALPLAEFITLGVGIFLIHHSKLYPTGDAL